jgi:predicted Zn-dependent protease
MKTAEQIALETDDKNGLANIRAINKAYRLQDKSNLWPINNRFNVTERAIRQVRKVSAEIGGLYGLEYCYALEAAMSHIVNSAV